MDPPEVIGAGVLRLPDAPGLGISNLARPEGPGRGNVRDATLMADGEYVCDDLTS